MSKKSNPSSIEEREAIESTPKKEESRLDPSIEARIDSLNLSFVSADDESYQAKQSNEPIAQTQSSSNQPDPFAHIDELGLELIKPEPKAKIEDDEPSLEKTKKSVAANDENHAEAKKKPFFQRKLTNQEVVKTVIGLVILLLILRSII